jgi:hypothetical protein
MQRAQGYNRLADFDYSFLPASFWRDEVYYKQYTGDCLSCGDSTERFNATIGTWECSECGREVEETDAELSGQSDSIPLALFEADVFSKHKDQ